MSRRKRRRKDKEKNKDTDKDKNRKKRGKKDKAEKKDKKVKKSKSKKEKGKHKKDKKSKKSTKRKGKKVDKRRNRATRDSVSNQFGKYGVIKAEDFFAKKPEFLLWAMEVKKENTDAMGQMQMKDLFKEYIEDYNTATMPSKKFYNLQLWDAQQTAKLSKKRTDMTETQRAALASFDDERARREEIKHLQAKKQEAAITDEVRRMKADKGKVEEMKHQGRLRVQMDMLTKSGFQTEANKIADRLAPSAADEPRRY